MIISELKKTSTHGTIPGKCANCAKDVYESMWLLDDAYNVWMGKCPHCSALNFLSMNHGLRGYSSRQMWLVLPTIEERKDNNLPDDCPVSGSGGPANLHGTNAGEILHQLRMEGAK